MQTGIPGVDQLIQLLVYGGLSLAVFAIVLMYAETKEQRRRRV